MPSDKGSYAALADHGPDTFDTEETEDPPEPPRASIELDDLPIELIGLTDSFIESLQAKVHPSPPNIDALSQKFQEFYATSSSHIATHLAALASRQHREQATAASSPARPSAARILRAKAASISGRDKSKTPTPPPAKTEAEQQMITANELADRKRQRRALEIKRSLLEEAVERRLCEGIYDRIYRHRTTQDEAQDDKLRSKTAALDVVGIGPADLGVDLGELPPTPDAVQNRQTEVRQWLDPARKELVRMNQTHYPLGKLNRLKAAHKGIVDTLAHFHPSSSADEIMPMLIYTLITLPPEKLNVVSDLCFIQRFRWGPKIDGEAAYCMTNLEAAVSFLDTVDLSTLRADEAPSGPAKTPGVETSRTETFPPAYSSTPDVFAGPSPGLSVTSTAPSMPEVAKNQATATTVASKTGPSATAGLRPAVQLRNRRLSDLVNTPAQALSTASDAVLNTFSAADQGLKTIGNSLEGSYRLFFGKLGQQQQQNQKEISADAAGPDSSLVPKTLDEARKLISTPPPAGSEDEASVGGEDVQAQQTPQTTPPQLQRPPHRRASDKREDKDKFLAIIGGRKASASRDHSTDSSRSATSGSRRVAFADDETASTTSITAAAAAGGAGAASNPALIDSVRSLGSSLNPISRLTGIGGFRGFGRTMSSSAVPAAAPDKADGGDLVTAFPDLAASLPPKVQVAPPVKRFLELNNAAELRISEVAVLLRDYQRLAAALKELGGFKEQ